MKVIEKSQWSGIENKYSLRYNWLEGNVHCYQKKWKDRITYRWHCVLWTTMKVDEKKKMDTKGKTFPSTMNWMEIQWQKALDNIDYLITFQWSLNCPALIIRFFQCYNFHLQLCRVKIRPSVCFICSCNYHEFMFVIGPMWA